jgi:hypothetical protein
LPEGCRLALFALPFHTIFYTPIIIFMEGRLLCSPFAGYLASLGFGDPVACIVEQLGWVVFCGLMVSGVWSISRRLDSDAACVSIWFSFAFTFCLSVVFPGNFLSA